MWSQLDNSFQLLTIVQNSGLNEEAFAKFSADFSALNNTRDRLKNNYTLDKLDVAHHLMFDALYTRAGKFVACAGIYRRHGWPAGAYRLLNRTFFSPQFRDPARFRFFASDYILPSQLSRCSVSLDFKFVSRQGVFAGNFLRTLQRRPLFCDAYHLSTAYIQVVPNVFDPLSFQKILYCKVDQTASYRFNSVSKLDKIIEKKGCQSILL